MFYVVFFIIMEHGEAGNGRPDPHSQVFAMLQRL